MVYELITTRNLTANPVEIFVYLNETLNGFPVILFLMMIWIIFGFGSYFIRKQSSGVEDLPASLAIGGFVTSVISILMVLSSLVNVITVTIVVSITILSLIWLFFTNKN